MPSPLPPPQEDTQQDEYCPICKSSRYLNPSISFVIEPSCYHRMCQSCVDRLFSAGPANCPVAGCTARLRAVRFRKQTFADLAVEREVDIRRRVAKVYNRREEEFVSKREWDDYLEGVEEVTFELLSGSEDAERRLKEYEDAHREKIIRNAEREKAEKKALQMQEEARKEEVRLAREVKALMEQEEKKEHEEYRRRQLRALEKGENIETVKKEFEARQEARRKGLEMEKEKVRALREGREMMMETWKMDAAGGEEEEEEEWKPLGDMPNEEWVALPERWEPNQWVDEFAAQPMPAAGGYMREEFLQRCLQEVFEGLTIFISDDEEKQPLDTGRTDVVMVDPVS